MEEFYFTAEFTASTTLGKTQNPTKDTVKSLFSEVDIWNMSSVAKLTPEVELFAEVIGVQLEKSEDDPDEILATATVVVTLRILATNKHDAFEVVDTIDIDIINSDESMQETDWELE